MKHEIAEQFCKDLVLNYISSGKIPDDDFIQETVKKAVHAYHVALETAEETSKEIQVSSGSKMSVY